MFHISNRTTLIGGKLTFLIGGIFVVLVLSGWINIEPESREKSAQFQVMSTGLGNASALVDPVVPPYAPPSQNGEEVDVIRNGDFEEPFEEDTGVAPEWSPFTNGQAFVGWYDEQWPEAVFSGEHAQLMEIDEVDGDVLDSVVAIFQTVDVVTDSEYALTINAIMRTDAPENLRNNFEYEMNWGIDLSGAGDYDNVSEWVFMPLTEQLRIGSNGEFPDDVPLFYETVTGTVRTGASNRITLFIRGVKKFPTGTEVDFDVDDVSLIGPNPDAAPPDGQDDQASDFVSPPAAPVQTDSDLPETGAQFSKDFSVGAFAFGGLVLVAIGTAAAASLLEIHKRR